MSHWWLRSGHVPQLTLSSIVHLVHWDIQRSIVVLSLSRQLKHDFDLLTFVTSGQKKHKMQGHTLVIPVDQLWFICHFLNSQNLTPCSDLWERRSLVREAAAMELLEQQQMEQDTGGAGLPQNWIYQYLPVFLFFNYYFIFFLTIAALEDIHTIAATCSCARKA